MTIFDYLNSVLYTKKHIELNCDEESQFNSFMFNRWIGFYSKELNSFINDTGNKYATVYNTKQDQFNYYFYILPKLKFKKIDYIKKAAKKDEEKDEVIVPEFYSKKEYEYIVEFSKTVSK